MAKIKHCSFLPVQQLTYITNYFNTIEDVSFGFDLNKQNGDAPGPLGDFVKSLVTERHFLFFPFFLKKSQ